MKEKQQPEAEMNGTPVPASSLLSAADILAADDTEYVDVPMPEWSGKRPDGSVGTVRLRSLTNDELVEYTESLKVKDHAKVGNVLLVLKSAVNDNGDRLFSMAQLQQLQAKSSKPFNRLAKAALKLNGVVGDADEVAQAKNA